MKIKRIALIALIGAFGLTFSACQEEDVSPENDQVLNTEGDKGNENGPDDF